MIALLLAVLLAPPASAEGVLRVCADPNNMPFSNARGEGFENRVADILARELNDRVEYDWSAQRRAFVRRTLKANRCDVVLGLPAGFGRGTATTRPYYRSRYVFVTRADRGLDLSSLDDPRLKTLKIAVPVVGEGPTPPARALAARGIVDNVVGVTVYGDYRQRAPTADLLRAVDAGDVDVAIAWGPLAGWYAKRAKHPLAVAPLPEKDGELAFGFEISAAVRAGDAPLRDKLDAALEKRAGDIRAVLEAYGVPNL